VASQESSFDIVSKLDRQEVDNALNQAAREIGTRFDFRGVGASIAWSGDHAVDIRANSEERAQVQGDELRVSAKKKDDLQAVIALLKGKEFDFALQFVNYRLHLNPLSRPACISAIRSPAGAQIVHIAERRVHD